MTIDELKRRIDLERLAEWLGVKKSTKGGKTSWHSPNRPDKTPSLSIYRRKDGSDWLFKDHASGEGGSCVDFVMYVRGCSFGDALKLLHEFAGVPMEARQEERREKSRAEFIAERCLERTDQAVGYLVDERKIPESIVRRAIGRRTVGFNLWQSDKVAAGEVGHGGPAVAFIVLSNNPGHVVAVDLRYLDPEKNGGVKTMSQGEKHGFPWCSDWRRVHEAHTVHIVESAINALTVEAAEIPGIAAVATRGTATVEGIDWRFLQGKQAVLGFDNDAPDAKTGIRAGRAAAWKLHELLTGLDISALMLDQDDWGDINDLNDFLKAKGLEDLRGLLRNWEQWLIPGQQPYDKDKPRQGRQRVFLPYHDDRRYWSYRVKPDFSSVVQEVEDEDGNKRLKWNDLAGFRVAGISRVSISGAVSTMTGDPDNQPKVMFAVSVQTPRHGSRLVRRVLEDEKLHNIEAWKKFGPVFNQSQFLRMVNILERPGALGERKVVNFVGLAWRDGKLIVNEGPSCYFTNPEQQCPYHNLTFPSGNLADARAVIQAYQRTFLRNAAAIPLVWGLGAHLKAFLGFWPHLSMQASKGAGKSTLTKHLERSIAMTMFSGQSIETPFRILTSLSHTSHPVGWEELSARKMQTIDFAISQLQEGYQYSPTRRGAELTEFLVCAPVLLAGEDVPVKPLIGKLVRTDLDRKKAEPLRHDLPRFPVRQWLDFLAGQQRKAVLERYEGIRARHLDLSRASGDDDGAVRMAGNYAAIALAWELLCEFAELDPGLANFPTDLVAEMNGHIGETSADREPWVWIVETVLSEIATGNFRHPYTWDVIKPDDDSLGEPCLLLRTSHVMDHLQHTSSLRDKWNSLSVKSDRVFKKELKAAGIIVAEEIERTIGGDQYGDNAKRVSYLTALSIERMRKFGLYVVGPAAHVPEVPRRPQSDLAAA